MASGLDVQGQFTAARPEYGFNLIRWLPVGFVMRLSLRTLMVSAMLGLAALGSGPAWADDDDDERISVQEEVRRGQILPFETIFGRIRSENRGEYVGAQCPHRPASQPPPRLLTFFDKEQGLHARPGC